MVCVPVKKGVKLDLNLRYCPQLGGQEKIEFIELWNGDIIKENFWKVYESDIKRVRTSQRLILYPLRKGD